jgi:hypothetical protein
MSCHVENKLTMEALHDLVVFLDPFVELCAVFHATPKLIGQLLVVLAFLFEDDGLALGLNECFDPLKELSCVVSRLLGVLFGLGCVISHLPGQFHETKYCLKFGA